MNKYIGITIGPIFDMMSLASSPAHLWLTSFLFSSISKKTCELLYEKGAKFIAPFYEDGNDLFNKNNGIGLFHDRVIIEKSDLEITAITEIKKAVFEDISQKFGVPKEKLDEYILFAAAEFEVEHPILDGGIILDSLELSKKIPFAEKSNPFLMNNEEVKTVAKNLGIDFENWALVDTSRKNDKGENLVHVKSLGDISRAGKHKGMKKNSYYAIVRSDGDNMSHIMKNISTDELPGFSKKCLEYCSEVSEIVARYNGITIYSSGDDLLAIMPCQSTEDKTLFDFVVDVNEKFEKIFDSYINDIKKHNQEVKSGETTPVPSLSFGIFICFEKFPLYEALAESASLLFDIAKTKKSCLAIKLQKHSGQSEGLLIDNGSLNHYLDVQNPVLENAFSSDTANMVLLSALYKTELFEKLFLQATDEKQVYNLFENVFDAPDHSANDFVHKVLPEFYNSLLTKDVIIPLDESGIAKDSNTAKVFSFALRILKFFVEKGKKEEK